MSRHTIELLDRLSDVANWNGSIDTVRHEVAGYDLTGFVGPQRTAAEDEIRRWTEKRDRKLARLKKIVSELSSTEIELIRRRYHPDKLRGATARDRSGCALVKKERPRCVGEAGKSVLRLKASTP